MGPLYFLAAHQKMSLILRQTGGIYNCQRAENAGWPTGTQLSYPWLQRHPDYRCDRIKLHFAGYRQ